MVLGWVIGAVLLAAVVVIAARHWPARDAGPAPIERLAGPAALLVAGNVCSSAPTSPSSASSGSS